jgi:hypothetical protein
MNGTKLHWVDGHWRGKLALAARPRGGDWLDDELRSWQREGVNIVLSLLTRDEENDLDIADEASTAKAHGMGFLSFPILDRHVPESEPRLSAMLDELDAELAAGRNVVAVERLSAARGIQIPETQEQRYWIDDYANHVSVAR